MINIIKQKMPIDKSQQEIERTSERTKVGSAGIIIFRKT